MTDPRQTPKTIEEKIECNVCGSAPMDRCPGCGAPHCSSHALSSELCLDCQLALTTQTGRVKLVLTGVLGLLALMIGALAAVADASVMSGLAGVAISVPCVVLVADLGGRVAGAVLSARRRRGLTATASELADALPDPSAVSGD